jgi:hypothetical protein
MLNNLTNFFNLIKGRMIKTQLEDSDLIAIGTRQSLALGDYKPTAILFSDLQAQLGGGGTVNYAKVAYVDRINGDDLTGALGNFGKAYLDPTAAMTAANAFGFTATYRGLVYLRQGTYSGTITLLPNIDVYCEPGVVFISGGFIDSVTTGSVGIYGFAKFVNTSIALIVSYSSTIYMEFDEADQGNTSSTSSLGVLEIKPNSAYNCNVIVKCRKIKSYCTNAYAVTIRGKSNVNLTVEESIEGPYDPIYLRQSADGTNFSGTLNISCPKIITSDGGWAGNLAAFKSGIKIFRITATARITINGNFVNNCAGYYGTGVCAVNASSGTQETVIVNGDINSSFAGGFNVSGTGSKFIFKGSMNVGGYPVLTNGTAELKIMNSAIVTNDLVGYPTVAILAGSSKVYFINTNISHSIATNISNANPTSYVYHYNTQAYCSNVTPGTFAAGGNLGVASSISNVATAGTSTNVFTTLDLTTDALFKLPTF